MIGESHEIDNSLKGQMIKEQVIKGQLLKEQMLKEQMIEWAMKYNDPLYFSEDPIVFPRHFADRLACGEASLQDVEIAAVIAAHLAWGRRSMIVRDCTRAMDEMCWQPYRYVMSGEYRNDESSLHRTVKWSEFAAICGALRRFYECDSANARNEGKEAYENRTSKSLEMLDTQHIRTEIYGRKEDPKAADKKINMMRRWMVRRDGKVDLGLWTATSPDSLVIPLDVHVYDEAYSLGLTSRKQKDLRTAMEITDFFRVVFPGDPCLGDFALFGYGVSKNADK